MNDDYSSVRPLLGGVTVLELGDRLSTAYCGRLLTDLGAGVHKLETQGGGPVEHRDPRYAAYLNEGKRSISESDLSELTVDADLILCDDARTTSLARRVRADNPDSVVVTMSDFGLGGPFSAVPATELTLQAEAGIVAINPHGSRPPVMVGVPLSELSCGTVAATGGVQALLSRDAGAGEIDVDVSRFESLVSLTQYPWMTTQIEGHWPYVAPANPVPGIEEARDGWVCVIALTADQWLNFKKMANLPELDDSRFDLATERFKFSAELTLLVRRFTRQHTINELVDLGVAHRVPITPVATAQTVAGLAPYSARHGYIRSATGNFDQPRAPFRIDEARSPDGPDPGSKATVAGPLTDSSPQYPLRGIRVAELGLFQAGPLISAHLATLGADVIKVESIMRPDLIRFQGGPASAPQTWERAAAFLAPNIGKRAITADLGDPRGLDIVKRLIGTSDVVIENYAPRTLSSRGLDFAGIRSIKSDNVVLRMPAWGLDGPWRERPGFTFTANATCGLADLTGYSDADPSLSGTIVDPIAAQYGVLVVLAALRDRARTGRGCSIELALCDVASQLTAQAVIEVSSGSGAPRRTGNSVAGILHQDVYRCAHDEWVAISVSGAAQLTALQQLLMWAPAKDDEDGDALAELLIHYCAGHDASTVVAALRSVDVPVASVTSGGELPSHPQLVARQRVFHIDQPVAGRTSHIGPPARYSHQPAATAPGPAPLFGQDNRAVLGELGFSAEQIAEFIAANVIGNSPFGLPLPPAAAG